MEDMSQEVKAAGDNSSAGAVSVALGELLREHKGTGVTVLDLREMNVWTDFFVIATVSSNTHLQGLERHIKEFCREQDLEILRRSRKPDAEDDEWCLIDLGSTVVHLMSSRARAFYELERLYSPAALLTQPVLLTETEPFPHSSNSSYSSSSSSS